MTKIIGSLLVVIMTAPLAFGDEKDGFWDKLQYRLEKVTPVKKSTKTTAVGGVRGDKNDAATDLYWKGKDKTPEVSDDELLKFNSAVKSKLKGDNELALKQFEEFNTDYPYSILREDGLQAVEMIKLELSAKGTLNSNK